MGYTILDRPAGTYAFAPGIVDQLAPLLKAGGQGLTDMIYRKAAEKEGLQSSYKKDAEGNWTTSYEKPTNSSLDAINKIFGVKKNIKEAKIDAEAPKLANATSYYRKAIEAGGDPEKLAGMVRPERFAYPEQQKQINDAIKTGFDMRSKEKSAEKAAKPNYNDYVKKAAAGEITWDHVINEFPTKVNQIKKLKDEFTPIESNPNFKEGWGIPAWLDPNKAKITPETRKVIGNIKTKADLQELLDNEKDYTSEGVDVKAVREYFGIKA